MSNATHDSRNPGNPKRRRRSRGGRNRNNNSNNRNQENRGGESRGQNRRQGQGRQQGRQDTRPARKYSKPKLTWWQKLLKAIGLYKEPQRPARKVSTDAPAAEPKPPKSNTRNARTGAAATLDEEGGPKKQRRKRERTGDRPRGGDAGSVGSSRLYVGNLSYDVTESDLQDLFKGVGSVRNVEIVYNRSTHRSKGYGFVEMLNTDEAKRAVEILHDQFFMGRKMNVSGAQSKGLDEREDRGDDSDRDRDTQPSAATRPKPADIQDPTITTVVEAETPAAGDDSATEETSEVLNQPAPQADESAEDKSQP